MKKNRIYNYCTLFDSHYLTRGLSMYYSLKESTEDNFHLYIFSFDETCNRILKSLDLPSVTIISLEELERNSDLLKVKNERTLGEYCWTATPSIIWFCLKFFQLDSCTYIDSDLFFYSNPNSVIEEMGNASVSIISHRYTKRYDQTKKSGKYCVQFMTFKNNDDGLTVLDWWKNECINWCYARYEDGKFGDQKYLDDWPKVFRGIYEIQNLGAGIAPWNVQQYQLIDPNKKIFKKIALKKEFNLVFFHFHGLKFINENEVYLNTYYLSKEIIKHLYLPYIHTLKKFDEELKSKFPIDFTVNEKFKKPTFFKKPLWKIPFRILFFLIGKKNYILKLNLKAR